MFYRFFKYNLQVKEIDCAEFVLFNWHSSAQIEASLIKTESAESNPSPKIKYLKFEEQSSIDWNGFEIIQ